MTISWTSVGISSSYNVSLELWKTNSSDSDEFVLDLSESSSVYLSDGTFTVDILSSSIASGTKYFIKLGFPDSHPASFDSLSFESSYFTIDGRKFSLNLFFFPSSINIFFPPV